MPEKDDQIKFISVGKVKSLQDHNIQERQNELLVEESKRKFKRAIFHLLSAAVIAATVYSGGYIKGVKQSQKEWEYQQELELAELDKENKAKYSNALAPWRKECQEILNANKTTLATVHHTLTQDNTKTYQQETMFGYEKQPIADFINEREQIRAKQGLSNDTKYFIACLYEMIPVNKYNNVDQIIQRMRNENYSNLEEYILWNGYDDLKDFIEGTHWEQVNKTDKEKGMGL